MLNPNLYKQTVLFQTIQFSVSTNYKCKYLVYLSKTFLFQAIQFSQTVLIQTILFSIGVLFVHTKLNVKTLLSQAIQFSVNTVSMTKTVLFQNIQFSISMHFSSIWHIDRILSGVTTSGQSGPGSDGNERVHRILQNSNITETLLAGCFCVISLWRGLTTQQRSNRCILWPQLTGLLFNGANFAESIEYAYCIPAAEYSCILCF